MQKSILIAATLMITLARTAGAQGGAPLPTPPPPPAAPPAPVIPTLTLVTENKEFDLTAPTTLSLRSKYIKFKSSVPQTVKVVRGTTTVDLTLPANTLIPFVIIEAGSSLASGKIWLGEGSEVPSDLPIPATPYNILGVPTTTVDLEGVLRDEQDRAARNAQSAAEAGSAAAAANAAAIKAQTTADAAKAAAANASSTATAAFNLATENGKAISQLTTALGGLSTDLDALRTEVRRRPTTVVTTMVAPAAPETTVNRCGYLYRARRLFDGWYFLDTDNVWKKYSN